LNLLELHKTEAGDDHNHHDQHEEHAFHHAEVKGNFLSTLATRGNQEEIRGNSAPVTVA
jgi:hypothetical protein